MSSIDINDYHTEPMGDGDSHRRCVHCKKSCFQINGNVLGHEPSCVYRVRKLHEQCVSVRAEKTLMGMAGMASMALLPLAALPVHLRPALPPMSQWRSARDRCAT